MIRPATTEDASSLAAIGLEVWIDTCQRQGVSGFFADYASGDTRFAIQP